MSWQAVIGLEVHAQLATSSKIFSGAATAYGAEANAQACAVDLGLPGVLPVINQRVIEMAIRFGLAIEASIAQDSVFARKNYFYPDLPKGYQISQYENPIVANGRLAIVVDGERRIIDITRAHLEEDAGKSIHGEFGDSTGIDLNRAGTPLLEIVSEPVMHSAREAVAYMRELHRLVRFVGICDGNMQEGSFRCDANVSVRRAGETKLGTRTETKNLNSFRFVERAIEFEIERQIEVLEDGGTIRQETRLYDPDRDETRTMRTKEDAHDYRYFPDPDLLPLIISDEQIDAVKSEMPELPAAKRTRYSEEYDLSADDIDSLLADPKYVDYFEQCVAQSASSAKALVNWITGELFGAMNRESIEIDSSPVTPSALIDLIARIEDDTVSGKIAKQVFQALWDGEGPVDEIIEKRGLRQVSDAGEIESIVSQVISENPDQVAQFLSGKDKVLGFLVGQVMKKSGGKANPKSVNEVMRTKLAAHEA